MLPRESETLTQTETVSAPVVLNAVATSGSRRLFAPAAPVPAKLSAGFPLRALGSHVTPSVNVPCALLGEQSRACVPLPSSIFQNPISPGAVHSSRSTP